MRKIFCFIGLLFLFIGCSIVSVGEDGQITKGSFLDFSPLEISGANFNNSLANINNNVAAGNLPVTPELVNYVGVQTPMGQRNQSKTVHTNFYGNRSFGSGNTSYQLTDQQGIQRQSEEEINRAGVVVNPKSRR